MSSGIILAGPAAPFAKATIFDDWPVADRGLLLAFWRATFAALVLIPGVRRPRWNGYLVPLGLCFTGMNIAFLTAMTRTTAANTTKSAAHVQRVPNTNSALASTTTPAILNSGRMRCRNDAPGA